MATKRDSNYQRILNELKSGPYQYNNEASGICYSKGNVMFKIKADGSMQFFKTVEQMARAINKTQKTGC